MIRPNQLQQKSNVTQEKQQSSGPRYKRITPWVVGLAGDSKPHLWHNSKPQSGKV
jgi:hypothetical protein